MWGFFFLLVLLIPLAIWLGHAETLLIAAAVVAPAFALFFVWLARRRLSAAKPE